MKMFVILVMMIIIVEEELDDIVYEDVEEEVYEKLDDVIYEDVGDFGDDDYINSCCKNVALLLIHLAGRADFDVDNDDRASAYNILLAKVHPTLNKKVVIDIILGQGDYTGTTEEERMEVLASLNA